MFVTLKAEIYRLASTTIETLQYDEDEDEDEDGNARVCSQNAPLHMRFTSRWHYPGKVRQWVSFAALWKREFCVSKERENRSIAMQEMAKEQR